MVQVEVPIWYFKFVLALSEVMVKGGLRSIPKQKAPGSRKRTPGREREIGDSHELGHPANSEALEFTIVGSDSIYVCGLIKTGGLGQDK